MRATLHASVGSTEAANEIVARFGVVGPKRASVGLNTPGSGNQARADDSTVSGASGTA
jgi:hypothetical protein